MMQATPATWRMLHRSPSAWTRPLLPAGCRVLCGGEALPPDLARASASPRPAIGVEPLRPDRDHDLVGAPSCSTRRTTRPALGGPIGQHQPVRAGRRSRPVPLGVVGRALHRRRRAGPWLSGRPGLTGRALRARSVRGAGSASVPHRRPVRAGARTACSSILGRVDHQVKIRGFRIEPGEIEARLWRAHAACARPSWCCATAAPGDRSWSPT